MQYSLAPVARKGNYKNLINCLNLVFKDIYFGCKRHDVTSLRTFLIMRCMSAAKKSDYTIPLLSKKFLLTLNFTFVMLKYRFRFLA